MSGNRSAALRKVVRSAAALDLPAATDRELLRRFARDNDQTAFEAIVTRHTAMVLGVCRRALSNVQDAEDACQATFLVLANRAKSVRWQESIANWLYTTARKVAHNAKLAAERRTKREAGAAVPEAVEQVDRMTGRELLAALDGALDRLPSRYREPLVLCYLEGLTRDEAANRLGIPLATLHTRIDRARKQLYEVLTKAGCTLGICLLTLAVISPAGASMPRLVQSILANASGNVPAAVSELVKGVAVNVSYSKLVLALAAVVVVVLGAGLCALDPSTAAQPPAKVRVFALSSGEKAQRNDEGKRKETDRGPKEIDPKVIESWKKAGATLGWYGRNKFGYGQFFEEKPKDLVCLPAFGLPRFDPGVIAKLPAPSVPFALALRTEGMAELEMTDAGLKELAGLENLQSLHLTGTKLTDAGLKELAALKNMKALDLANALQVTDAGMKELAGVKNLKNLRLSGARKMTNAGVKALAALENLQSLDLERTQVTDSGLKDLAGLKSLQVLNLTGTEVTDAGLIELIGLKSLEILELTSTQVTDAGLKNLAGFQDLRILELTGTKVTDTGLKELADLKSLQILGLSGTQVTDAGLKELAGFKSLLSIYVSGPQITDAGLKHLAGLKSLLVLGLRGTQVTDAGVAELRKIHHNLVIVGRR